MRASAAASKRYEASLAPGRIMATVINRTRAPSLGARRQRVPRADR